MGSPADRPEDLIRDPSPFHTVERCDWEIQAAKDFLQHALQNKDEYPAFARREAARSVSRWERERELAVAVDALVRQRDDLLEAARDLTSEPFGCLNARAFYRLREVVAAVAAADAGPDAPGDET